jgi:hypothetical protein
MKFQVRKMDSDISGRTTALNFLSAIVRDVSDLHMLISFRRMRSTRRPFVPKCKFEPQEDHMLVDVVSKMGQGDWNRIAAMIPGRNARQCRERWNNYANPELVKEEWKAEEDEILLRKYRELGPKWYAITVFLPGRAKNDIRNRFTTLQRRRTESEMHKRQHMPIAWAVPPRPIPKIEAKEVRTEEEKPNPTSHVSLFEGFDETATGAWPGECDLENLLAFFSSTQ